MEKEDTGKSIVGQRKGNRKVMTPKTSLWEPHYVDKFNNMTRNKIARRVVGRQRCVIANITQQEIHDRCRKMRDQCDSGKWSEDEVPAKRIGKNEDVRWEKGKAYRNLVNNSNSKEPFECIKACTEGRHNGV